MPVKSLLDEFKQITRAVGNDAHRFTEQVTILFQDLLLAHPQKAFQALRVVKPVLVYRDAAIVTRFHDVVEVLTHDREFTVDMYGPPMQKITGDFILGLNQGPAYERGSSLLRLAFRQSDAPRVADLAAETAGRLVAEVLPSGRVDVVRDICDRVPAALVAQYLGVAGPDEPTLIEWSRVLFAEMFVNLTHDGVIAEQAAVATAGIQPHVDALVAGRRAALAGGEPARDTVLDRLLRQQALGSQALTDAEIRSNLIGLLVGMIPTISKASALAVDALLDRPMEWAAACSAARAGDHPLFARYVDEAMRLSPQTAGLIRRTVTDYRIARGTHHETLVPAGTYVFAATQSAMLDGSVVTDPTEFRIDRPASDYLHYGAGLHTCFGRFLNRLVIPAIVKAVLSIEGVRRQPGAAGELAIDGNFPTSMVLTFPRL
ncbi:cytochrome P450 [Streptomyces albipurpureus]|uniref:Cytochrome P450 n=1 Tax=Streptomyces albipurpureus TaxID=2897419 RepID=A0ABT0UID6_9ACTN|nr:cytochrome P450 [Streptomyces sp. CWNU-1]MCM2387203.1 cytochrome P450 [Streptomyces sp. CWNU-1]